DLDLHSFPTRRSSDLNNYCSINCLKDIEIGENTLFGEGVRIYDHNHQYSYENAHLNVNPREFTFGAVKIGQNCWLGSNVVVLKRSEEHTSELQSRENL